MELFIAKSQIHGLAAFASTIGVYGLGLFQPQKWPTKLILKQKESCIQPAQFKRIDEFQAYQQLTLAFLLALILYLALICESSLHQLLDLKIPSKADRS